MAYWSSTNFDQYARHDSWNVKPRWQELAEMSSSFSSAAKTPTLNMESMASTPDHAGGDPRYRTRRGLQLLRENNTTGLGASRSRSRSRPGRLSTRMVRTPSRSRQRSKSVLGRAYPYAISKQNMFLMLLALVNVLLSWFGSGVLSYSGPFVRSVVGRVWTPQNDSLEAHVRHNLCRIPLVPKSLHCSGPSGIETVSRDQSIQTALPGIAVALSKNPEAIHGILDTLEEIKKHLSILQPKTSHW